MSLLWIIECEDFTRDLDGTKLYMDHEISSIQDYIEDEIVEKYTTIDINLDHSNIFHTKMMLNQFVLDNYIFNLKSEDLSKEEISKIHSDINREIAEIFYGMNMPHMK
jgi:S-adenosylmethionine decarboxylase